MITYTANNVVSLLQEADKEEMKEILEMKRTHERQVKKRKLNTNLNKIVMTPKKTKF